jgi:4,5-dihydroxyphthalate decarboxylase
MSSSKIRLSVAMSDYDHTRDLMAGSIDADGIEITALSMPVEEIFFRFLHYGEWDVSELSFAKYLALKAAGKASFTAIPVFPSRMFRMSSIYVRADSALTSPEQLAGLRVGLPEWAQTAAVYTRGWIAETVGIPLSSINWVQAGVNQPGRAEKVAVALPAGVNLRPAPETSLTELLRSGGVDAVFSAHPPAPFEAGTGEFRQMISDTQKVEEDYFRSTGIFPIMHVVAIRDAVLKEYPWVAQNLYKAFLAARATSLARLEELTASRFPLPWAAHHARAYYALFGELFPYGTDANHQTLEAFSRFAHQQGLSDHLIDIKDLFVPSTATSFRI